MGAPPRLSLDQAVGTIVERRRAIPARRSLLVGLSGIDGAGKGFVARRLDGALRRAGLRPALINVDGWLDLPARRFSPERPAERFYDHALRLEELFRELVLPLRARRSRRLVVRHLEETATAFRRRRYEFADVDVILLEGIFLFKRRYRGHFDLALWVDCTYATALERALARRQENLPPAGTVAAYRTIYFPAQEIHRERDAPRESADAVIVNDERLGASVAAA